MTLNNAQLILKIASGALIGLGGAVALAAHPATDGVTRLIADLVFWPLDGSPGLDHPAARLLAAIGGGVMVGWGVMLWQLATRLLPTDAALAGSLIRTGAIAWFVVDSIGSIVAGAPINALLNVGFLALFLLPLASARPTAATG